METLTSAVSNSIVPHIEFLLQGSIKDSSCEVLLHRLRGLCDNVDSGPETFHDHEMVFHIRGNINNVIPVRARRSIDHPGVPWHLRYVGQPEIDKNRPTLVRNCIDVATSENLVQFLNEMGFRLDHEFILKGYMFRKGRMKITVAKVFRMLQPGSTENLDPVTLSYLVELSIVAPSGQEAIADEMKAFSEQLKPYPLVVYEREKKNNP
ncbi:Mediator of RNA polymerase II transcription subunit 18 [Nymphon striatum]|nr:Mediator of RNA polymerase II transcription subunit 18 [Nymphon striatum]